MWSSGHTDGDVPTGLLRVPQGTQGGLTPSLGPEKAVEDQVYISLKEYSTALWETREVSPYQKKAPESFWYKAVKA